MDRFVRRLSALSGLALAVLMITGCGDDGFGKRYPVYGTISYNGEPVPQGNIYFVPDDPNGRPASGAIIDGEYQLSTVGENDGALPGSYKIRIIAVEADFTDVLANADGGAGRQDDVISANQSAKKLVPAKYELETTSGLTAEVQEQSNEINFDLTD